MAVEEALAAAEAAEVLVVAVATTVVEELDVADSLVAALELAQDELALEHVQVAALQGAAKVNELDRANIVRVSELDRANIVRVSEVDKAKEVKGNVGKVIALMATEITVIEIMAIAPM